MSTAEQDLKFRCHSSCRTCTNECLLLQSLNVNGLSLVELKSTSARTLIPFLCTACELCAVACTRKLKPGELLHEWRREAAASTEGLPKALNPLLPDQPENLNAAYRRAYPVNIPFPETHRAETTFFPGCALSTYTPELALAVFNDLQTRFPGIGWLDTCCYDLLDKLGLCNRDWQGQRRLEAEMGQRGIRRIITACPTCHYRLAKIFPALQVVSIYQILANEWRKVPGLPAQVALHESCADRKRGEVGKAVRSLLPPTVDLKHAGISSLCCGAGNGVNFVDPELAHRIARQRWAEVEASKAQVLVTYCVNCAVQLSRTGRELPVRHVLDLMYEAPQEYRSIAEKIRGVAEGLQEG